MKRASLYTKTKTVIFTMGLLCFLILGIAITSTAQVIDAPRDGLYDKIHNQNRKPVPYQYVREADVMWAKRIWRAVDLREKINHTFYFPVTPSNGRKSFMFVILNALKEGTITPYKPDPYNDEFLTPQTPDEIFQGLRKEKLVTQTRSYPPYDTYDTTIVEDFRPDDVKKLRLKEDWFIDKARSIMETRIIGIAPVTELFEADGETVKGDQLLFWLYFPELRPELAKNEVYNRTNPAIKKTYDDIFFKRLFGSFITKEENVYDRNIRQYKIGLDALLEAEQIKNQLFLYEHDLWEY